MLCSKNVPESKAYIEDMLKIYPNFGDVSSKLETFQFTGS